MTPCNSIRDKVSSKSAIAGPQVQRVVQEQCERGLKAPPELSTQEEVRANREDETGRKAWPF